jgi:TrmH family RNA methyltransferase
MRAVPRNVASRSNPLLARLRKLSAEPAAYRKLGVMLLEGEHLCAAWIARGRGPVLHAVLDEAVMNTAGLLELAESADDVVVVSAESMAGFSALESPATIAFVVPAPETQTPKVGMPTLVLDRVQDPGNVGALLRSAAAFGFVQVVALTGTAALWAPKVVRAGMGSHFALHLVESADAAMLDALALPLLGSSSHSPMRIDAEALPWPCAWALGHEGQGLSAAVASRCTRMLRIPQPGGEESLNVAAAGAVCLYESSRQRAATSVPTE